MNNPLAWITLTAYVVAALRILAYRRDATLHRWRDCWLAWVLLVALGGSAIDLMLHAQSVGLFEAGRAVLLSAFVLYARGNVARLLRSA